MNPVDEILEQVHKLLDSNLTAYKIQELTGVKSASIYTIRKDRSKVERLRLDTIKKLYDYAATLK